MRYFAYALSKTLIGILRIAKLYSHYYLLSDSKTTLINSITKNVLQSRLHYISISRVLDNTVNFVSTTVITTHSILSCFHVLVFFHHLEKIFVQNFKFGKLFGKMKCATQSAFQRNSVLSLLVLSFYGLSCTKFLTK